jgi:DNA-binding CsgD family transcriptional regulator
VATSHRQSREQVRSEASVAISLEPLAAWRNLMGGGWVVQDHCRSHDACTLVLASARGVPAQEILTAEELKMLARRARGVPLKVFGLELGLGAAAAARRVAGAMRKLRLECDDHLVAFFLSWPSRVVATATGEGEHDALVLSYRPPPRSFPRCLSPAERRVVERLLAGGSYATIARDEGLASRTVANQVASVHRKLDVHSRIELLVALRTPRAVAGRGPR